MPPNSRSKFKPLVAAAPGEGDYAVLHRNGSRRLGAWPPVNQHSGRTMMRRQQEGLAHVVWLLVNEPDRELHSPSGNATAMIVDRLKTLTGDESWTRDRVACVLSDGVSLGLFKLECAPRKTYRVKLRHAADTLPMPCPKELAQPAAPPDDNGEAERRAQERAIRERMEQREVVEASAPSLFAALAEPVAAPPENAELDYPALAVSLLNEVVRRTTSRPDDDDAPLYIEQERNHYRAKFERQCERIRTLERDLDVQRGLVKSLRSDLSVERQSRQQLEENLNTAAQAAHRYREQLGDLIDEDTKRNLDSIMRTAPGFDAYARVNGTGKPSVLVGS